MLNQGNVQLLDGNKSKDVLYAIRDIMIAIAENDIEKEIEPIGNCNRLLVSEEAKLIIYKGNEVGFIYGTIEHRYEKGLFLDMAISYNYRHKGIGSIAMEKFVNTYHGNKLLIAETRKSNDATRIMGPRYGALIPINNEKFNYYIFPNTDLSKIDLNEFEQAMSTPEENYHHVLKKIK